MSKAQSGTVKWFNEKKGYGFIERENEKDVFFHFSGLADPDYNPQQNDDVSFEVEETERGLNAIKVKLVTEEQPQIKEA